MTSRGGHRSEQSRSRRISVAAVAATLAAGLPVLAQPTRPQPTRPQPTRPQPTRPQAPFRIGAYERTIENLVDPARAVISDDGRIYVSEAGRGVISIFARSGERLGSFGSPGGREGQLVAARGLALGPGGTLLVADTGNHRVQVFTSEGRLLRVFGRYGKEDGVFNEPSGIAADDEHIFVADLGNHRVQVFDHAGAFVRSFGGYGAADGRFNRPGDLAVDDAGFVYVADTDNNRIQKFDPDGRFVKSWGDYGPFTGLMDEPSGLVFRPEGGGELFVADTRNHRIQIVDRDGALVFQWGVHATIAHQGDGTLHYPNDLAIAPSGAFAVICESFEDRCQIFAALPPDQDPQAAIPVAAKVNTSHFGERMDLEGALLTISEPELHRVSLFDTSREIPIVIGNFGERGKRFGQMIRGAGLELDIPGRRLYTSDVATRRVQAFALDYDPADARRFSRDRARFSKAYDLARMSAALSVVDLDWVIEPAEIERDGDGNLYVVDPRNSVVLVFDPAMRFLRSWGGYGTEPGRFRHPNDIAFGRDGETIFVVDSNNHRIQVFDRRGNFLRAWGGPGSAEGQFQRAFGIAAGRDGFVYVTDAAVDRVQKFSEAGRFITAWGRRGVDHGEFWKPKGIEQDEALRIYIVDQGNHRAQIFTPEGEWQVTFGLGRAYAVGDPRFQRERAGRREQQQKE